MQENQKIEREKSAFTLNLMLVMEDIDYEGEVNYWNYIKGKLMFTKCAVNHEIIHQIYVKI